MRWKEVSESCCKTILRIWDSHDDPRRMPWDKLYNLWREDSGVLLKDADEIEWVSNYLQTMSYVSPKTIRLALEIDKNM